MKHSLLVACLIVQSLWSQSPSSDQKIHGITISTHGSGRDWGSDRIVAAFQRAKSLGANWVAVHPYAGIRNEGTVRWRQRGEDPPRHWVRPIEEAHKLGLKILIKPHLAHWGSHFDWRGSIHFDKKTERERFFADYGRWIVAVAKACKKADAFSVGTELDGTTSHEKEWRQLISRIRAVTPSALTFASNWTDFDRLGFWDALDAVGIQAYFPVGKSRAGSEEIRLAWKKHMKRLAAFGQKTHRRVCFTELGYSQSFDAPLRPWEHHRDGGSAEAVQLRCFDAALSAIEAEPAVRGAFLWKLFPPPRTNGHNFRLDTPGVRGLLDRIWGRKSR